MAFPGRAAEGASAAQDAGRSDANLLKHQEVVHDCPSVPMASDRDFPWASSAWARQAGEGQGVMELSREPQQRAAWQKVVCPPVEQAASPEELRAFLQVQTARDESGL